MNYNEYPGWPAHEKFMRKNMAVGGTGDIGPNYAATNKIKEGRYTWDGKQVIWEPPPKPMTMDQVVADVKARVETNRERQTGRLEDGQSGNQTPPPTPLKKTNP